MNLKQKRSVIKRILFLFFLTLLTISANAERTDVISSNASKGDTTITIHDTIYINVKDVLNDYEKEITNLKKAKTDLEQINKESDNTNSELKKLNTNYSQSISQLITQVSNAISHIIPLPTNETSLNTINSVLTIAKNLSLLDDKKQLSNKVQQLKKYKEEFQIVYSANALLHNVYNREKNENSINKLKDLQLSDNKRNTEKNEILSLLEKYCGINNKIASLFTKVAALSDDEEKKKRLYKGSYYRYTKGYPFLYQELEKKKDNLKYKSPVKEVSCE